jgi:hypothetical protein
MRALVLSLPFLLVACTDSAPETSAVPGASGAPDGQVAAAPIGDPGPPDPRNTIVDDSTGVVAPSGEVLANAQRVPVADGRQQLLAEGPGPHRFLVAMRSGQRLSVEAEGGPTVSVFDPGGAPLVRGERSWSGTVNQTADFVIEAEGSGAVFVSVE